MKRVYERPLMTVERFVPNEYVAACGDTNTVYKFECNAGSTDKKYNVFLNGPDGKPDTSDDIAWTTASSYNPQNIVGAFHPCGTTHEASTTDDFKAGYIYERDSNNHSKNTGRRIDVLVWIDNTGSTHCTRNLDIDTWETTKS